MRTIRTLIAAHLAAWLVLFQDPKPKEAPVDDKPGALTIRGGKGGESDGIGAPGKDGSLIFQTARGEELFRWDGDGRAYVRGRYVETDREIYEGMTAWFRAASVAGAK